MFWLSGSPSLSQKKKSLRSNSICYWRGLPLGHHSHRYCKGSPATGKVKAIQAADILWMFSFAGLDFSCGFALSVA